MANLENDRPDGNTEPKRIEFQPPSIAYKPKRRTARVTKGTGKTKIAPNKRPVKLMLESDVYEALVIHGLRRGENLSDLVSSLVRSHLTDWVLHARPGTRSESA